MDVCVCCFCISIYRHHMRTLKIQAGLQHFPTSALNSSHIKEDSSIACTWPRAETRHGLLPKKKHTHIKTESICESESLSEYLENPWNILTILDLDYWRNRKDSAILHHAAYKVATQEAEGCGALWAPLIWFDHLTKVLTNLTAAKHS